MMGLTEELGLFIPSTKREGRREGPDASGLVDLSISDESSPSRGAVVCYIRE